MVGDGASWLAWGSAKMGLRGLWASLGPKLIFFVFSIFSFSEFEHFAVQSPSFIQINLQFNLLWKILL
jgi:hypothetical protein